jgi:hypothetical protein
MVADVGRLGGMSKPAFPPVMHTHFLGDRHRFSGTHRRVAIDLI